MARAPRPEDLYDLRIPTDLDLSPDGRFVAFSVKSVAPGKDGYRSSLWLAHDRWQRARAAADRRQQERHDAALVARRVAPGVPLRPRRGPPGRRRWRQGGQGRGAEGGRHAGLGPPVRRWRRGAPAHRPAEGRRGPRLVAGRQAAGDRQHGRLDRAGARSPSASRRTARRPTRGSSTRSSYQFNGAGFVHERFTRLWLVDAETGARRAPDPRQPPRRRSAVVARRAPDRVRLRPPPEPGPRLAQRHLPRRRPRRRGAPAVAGPRTAGLGRAVLVAGRPLGRRDRDARLAARRPAAGIGLALPRARRQAENLLPGCRPRGGRRHEQRPHRRAGRRARPGWPTAAGSSSPRPSTAPSSCGGSRSTAGGSSG